MRQSPSQIEAPSVALRSKDTAAVDPGVSSTKSSATVTTNAQPLAPPPRPVTTQQNPSETPDYFNQNHSSYFILELNPFEQSFGYTAAETPGKQILPPVASLTSPSSLLPGGTPGWANSLRSGPLSPAMLAGPAGTDYFSDSHFRGGFPTPNESSLRTGLTPGGGGSMFPAPSPNTQALFNSLGGGATPGTLDFHRTALSAAAAVTKSPAFTLTTTATTTTVSAASSDAIPAVVSATAPTIVARTVAPAVAPTVSVALPGMDQKPFPALPPPQPSSAAQAPLGQHDTDAANGLYMLANANGSRTTSQYPFSAQHAQPVSLASSTVPEVEESSPTLSKRSAKHSFGSVSGSVRGVSEMGDFSESGHSEEGVKPAPMRSRSKKGSVSTGAQGSSARRKADKSLIKGQASKRSRNNSGSAAAVDHIREDDSSEEGSPQRDDGLETSGGSSRKMTDEEKRRNFLERNRYAKIFISFPISFVR